MRSDSAVHVERVRAEKAEAERDTLQRMNTRLRAALGEADWLIRHNPLNEPDYCEWITRQGKWLSTPEAERGQEMVNRKEFAEREVARLSQLLVAAEAERDALRLEIERLRNLCGIRGGALDACHQERHNLRVVNEDLNAQNVSVAEENTRLRRERDEARQEAEGLDERPFAKQGGSWTWERIAEEPTLGNNDTTKPKDMPLAQSPRPTQTNTKKPLFTIKVVGHDVDCDAGGG